MGALGLLLFAAFTTELLSVVVLSVLNLLPFFIRPARRRSLLKGGAIRDVEPDVIATNSLLLSSCFWWKVPDYCEDYEYLPMRPLTS